MENEQARIELAAAHRGLAHYGLNEGVNNHISVITKVSLSDDIVEIKAFVQSQFDPEKEIMLMLPFGVLWSEAIPEVMIEVDYNNKTYYSSNGNEIELDFEKRTMELLMNLPLDAAYYLHSEIYKTCSNLRAIVHTHSRFVSSLTSLDNFQIKPVHQNSCRFIKNIGYDRTYGRDFAYRRYINYILID